MNIRKLTLILFLSLGLIAPVAAQTPPDEITLSLRIRDAKTGQVVIKPLKIDPRKVGIVIVDPWNYHWCVTFTSRLGAAAPLYNRALDCARRLGMQVLWAPTEAASMYAGTPQRERAAAVPLVPVPQVRDLSCNFTPHKAFCECGPGIPCEVNYGLDGICGDMVVKEDDWILSGAQETYSLCKAKGLTHLLMAGVAANMCLFGRPEGLKSMYTAGVDCILVRDLTDGFTAYEPSNSYTPDDGTAQCIADVEKAGVPSLSLVDEMRKVGLWEDTWKAQPVHLAPWGAEDRPYLFESSVTVTLTYRWARDVKIFYTVDGADPTPGSTPYEKPIVLSGASLVRAAAFRDEQVISPVSSGYFVRLGAPPPKPDIYLDQIEPIGEHYPYWYSSWHPMLNKSFENQPLLMRGKTYGKGVGMRAPSNIRYALKPEYDRFVALAGIDGNLIRCGGERYGSFPGGQAGGYACLLAQQPGMRFLVFIDGKQVAESAKLKIGQEPWRFDVKIPPNSRLINLVAAESSGRSVLNLGNWVEAGFVRKKMEVAVPWDEPVDADYKHASPEAYERFRDWKFGLRIYFYVGTQIAANNGSWVLYENDLPYHEKYHNLYMSFNPSAFNADEWADLLARSGCKYFTFTCKHHDGFAMWDTQTRVKRRYAFSGLNAGKMEDCDLAYSVAETPFKRDIVKELVEATRKRGLGIGLYFSHWDWYDADFRWSGIGRVPYDSSFSRQSDPQGYERFLKRHRDQIGELLTKFGKIDMLEFDCEPRGTYVPFRQRQIEDWARFWPDIKNNVKYARRLGPDVLFRERGIGSYGDFHTPEGVVPANPDSRTENASVKVWQVIYPAAGAASWTPNAGHQSAEWIVSNLIDITAKGGNFQVGYGPMPNGKFDPKAIERLEYVGDWLKVNGEAIYATRPRDGDLWKEGDDIRFTRSKDNQTVYAICQKWPGKMLTLKSIRPAEGAAITMLGVADSLKWKHSSGAGLQIEIPDALQDEKNRPCQCAWSLRITPVQP